MYVIYEVNVRRIIIGLTTQLELVMEIDNIKILREFNIHRVIEAWRPGV